MEYTEKNLARIAKRINNTKRGYLVVNPLQGKHIPASPTKALALFETLAGKLMEKYHGENLLIIGFAETATAIGAQVAVSLGMPYIHTTRETIPEIDFLFFSEEHSHASEQKLAKRELGRIIDRIDRIIFVEDEVTTGNTILNVIQAIQESFPGEIRYSVAAILNGMSREYMSVYDRRGIDLHYILKTDHTRYHETAEKVVEDGLCAETCGSSEDKIPVMEVRGLMDTRRLVEAQEYEKACRDMADHVIDFVGIEAGESLLVMGTEEFMFPAMSLGREMEKRGCIVRTHSTTRSPIGVSRDRRYPLNSRYPVYSLYDPERKTYVYNIDSYDSVIVITDSELRDLKGLRSLVGALKTKNRTISVVRWC